MEKTKLLAKVGVGQDAFPETQRRGNKKLGFLVSSA